MSVGNTRELWGRPASGDDPGIVVGEGADYRLKFIVTIPGHGTHIIWLDEHEEAGIRGCLSARAKLQDARDQLSQAIRPFIGLPSGLIQQAIAIARHEAENERSRG